LYSSHYIPRGKFRRRPQTRVLKTKKYSLLQSKFNTNLMTSTKKKKTKYIYVLTISEKSNNQALAHSHAKTLKLQACSALKRQLCALKTQLITYGSTGLIRITFYFRVHENQNCSKNATKRYFPQVTSETSVNLLSDGIAFKVLTLCKHATKPTYLTCFCRNTLLFLRYGMGCQNLINFGFF